MTARMITGALVALLLVGAVLPESSLHAQANRAVATIDGVPDTGQFLPSDEILARVDDRVIRIRDFVDGYFNSLIEYRPPSDSAGRAEFLRSMINKEVLALTAIAADRPLGFEDRLQLREHELRTLSNVLYRRVVLDSIQITDEDMREAYEEYRVQVRLREIVVSTREAAEKIRADLLARKIKWRDAVRKHSIAYRPDNPDGEVGWKIRIGFDAAAGEALFRLQPNEIAVPLEDQDGFHVMQCVERKPYDAPSMESLRIQIRDGIRGARSSQRSREWMGELARSMGMRYDTALIRIATQKFTNPRSFKAGELTLGAAVPRFAPEDTGKAVAWWSDGRVTLGSLLASYEAIPALMRPALTSSEAMLSHIHAIALEPRRVEIARELGLERDTLVLAAMERRLEQLRVEHLFRDSVESKVWIPSEERRAYYTANQHTFVTYPKVHYVVMYVATKEHADSLKAEIDAGATAEDVLHREGSAGRAMGEASERYQGDHGPFQKLLFEDLREGETTVAGPNESGQYVVLHSLAYSPGRQMSFDEAQSMIDESLRNMQGEKLLKELIARQSKKRTIVAYPEKLPRIRLVDSTREE